VLCPAPEKRHTAAETVIAETRVWPTAEGTSPLTITLKCIAVVMLVASAPSPSGAASVDRIVCNGLMHAYIDANEFAGLERARLNRDQFSGLIWLGLDPNRSFVPWTPKDLQDARRSLVLGFQLDDGIITGIHSTIAQWGVAITLTFSHLKRGRHRLRIGVMGHGGDLTLDQAYCFSTPGYFTLTGPKPVGS
jgi:hypothetical protein